MANPEGGALPRAPESRPFDPIAMADIAVLRRRDDGQVDMEIHATFSDEQASMAIRRFLLDKESLLIRLERGP